MISEWIPVGDRLPDAGKDVLVYEQQWRKISIAYYLHGAEIWEDVNALQPDVTHWMPLPEPPK